MAIALILFCVFQVMPVAMAAPVVGKTTSRPTVSTGMYVATTDMADEEIKHDKRSLNVHPFRAQYLGTQNKVLEIFPNGTVRGVGNLLEPEYGIMEIHSACEENVPVGVLDNTTQLHRYGKVSIRGNKSKLFLCMDSTGHVYGSKKCDKDCRFKQERLENSYTVYYSLKHRGIPSNKSRNMFNTRGRKKGKKKSGSKKRKWYLGIKENGEMRLGWRTKPKKKHAHFIEGAKEDIFGIHDTRYSLLSTTQPTKLDKNSSISVDTSHQVSSDRPPNDRKFTRRRHKNKERSRMSRRNQESGKNCDDPFALFRTVRCKNRAKKPGSEESIKALGPFSSRSRSDSRDLQSDPKERRKKFDLFSFPER